MNAYPCDLCDRPSGDGARVCTTCTGRATAALHEIADWLAEALADAIGRRTALGPTAGAGSTPAKVSEAPLPIDPAASEAASVRPVVGIGDSLLWGVMEPQEYAKLHPLLAELQPPPPVGDTRIRPQPGEQLDLFA